MIDLHIEILFLLTMSNFFGIPGIMFKYSLPVSWVQISLLELHLIKVYVKLTLRQFYSISYHKIFLLPPTIKNEFFMLHEDLFPVFVIHYLRCRRKARLSDIYVLFIVHNALRNWIVYGVTKGLEMMLHTLKKIYD